MSNQDKIEIAQEITSDVIVEIQVLGQQPGGATVRVSVYSGGVFILDETHVVSVGPEDHDSITLNMAVPMRLAID
jgi:hypothetical protein